MKKLLSLSLLLVWVLTLGLLTISQAQAAPPTPANFTVAPGQSATVRINIFCLDFTKNFPTNQNIQPDAPADAKLTNALAYAFDKGYPDSDPRQVQLAMWFLRDGVYHTNQGESNARAQEIVNNANTAASIPAGTGTSLADAQKNGQVSVTATGVQPLNQGQYYGTAVLEVRNLTQNYLNLNLTPGTTFVVNAASNPNAATFQTMIGYATGAQGQTQPTAAPANTGQSGQGGGTSLPATGAGGASKDDSDNAALLVAGLLLMLAIGASSVLVVQKMRRN